MGLFDKLSEESKDTIEFMEADDIQTFADLADTLDRRGFYKAANKVDKFIKILAAKKKDPDRQVAILVRHKRTML